MATLPRVGRHLQALFAAEGARITKTEEKTNHTKVFFTFDGSAEYITHVTRHRKLGDPRAVKNFRAEIRRNQRGQK